MTFMVEQYNAMAIKLFQQSGLITVPDTQPNHKPFDLNVLCTMEKNYKYIKT
uniref:Uncharacterized protein n=1 Tax=Anguilla anguilla TaxID=7936 RepID=A0A0E9SVH5_ANGAN